jgi:hypothetical protein
LKKPAEKSEVADDLRSEGGTCLLANKSHYFIGSVDIDTSGTVGFLCSPGLVSQGHSSLGSKASFSISSCTGTG